MLEEGLQRHRACQLAGPDQRRGGIEDARVYAFVEMLGGEKAADPVASLIVDQDRAQQCLFRLEIVRRLPMESASWVG